MAGSKHKAQRKPANKSSLMPAFFVPSCLCVINDPHVRVAAQFGSRQCARRVTVPGTADCFRPDRRSRRAAFHAIVTSDLAVSRSARPVCDEARRRYGERTDSRSRVGPNGVGDGRRYDHVSVDSAVIVLIDLFLTPEQIGRSRHLRRPLCIVSVQLKPTRNRLKI